MNRFEFTLNYGNQWTDTNNVSDVGMAINSRLDYLLGLSREIDSKLGILD